MKLLSFVFLVVALSTISYANGEECGENGYSHACNSCEKEYGSVSGTCIGCNNSDGGLGTTALLCIGSGLCIIIATISVVMGGLGEVLSVLFCGQMATLLLYIDVPKELGWSAGITSLAVTNGIPSVLSECVAPSLSRVSINAIGHGICLVIWIIAWCCTSRKFAVFHILLIANIPHLTLLSLIELSCSGDCNKNSTNDSVAASIILVFTLVAPLLSYLFLWYGDSSNCVDFSSEVVSLYNTGKIKHFITSASRQATRTAAFSLRDKRTPQDSMEADSTHNSIASQGRFQLTDRVTGIHRAIDVIRHLRIMSFVFAVSIGSDIAAKRFALSALIVAWLIFQLHFLPYRNEVVHWIEISALSITLFGVFMVGYDSPAYGLVVFVSVVLPLLSFIGWVIQFRRIYAKVIAKDEAAVKSLTKRENVAHLPPLPPMPMPLVDSDSSSSRSNTVPAGAPVPGHVDTDSRRSSRSETTRDPLPSALSVSINPLVPPP